MTLALLLGAVIGLVLGLTGAGGSVFAVPLLMLCLGWPLPRAASVALLAVAAAAAFGTITAWDVAIVRYRAALLMAATGLLVAPLGLHLAAALPAAVLSGLFAGVLVVVALRLLWQAQRRPAEAAVVRAAVAGDGRAAEGPVCLTHPQSGRLVWTRACAGLVSGIGLVTGFLSGLLGVGGGFVIVPALRAGTALSIHSAIATSLMVIALTASGTALLHGVLDRDYPWAVAAPFVLGALAGMWMGRRVAPSVSGPKLQSGFALAMLAVAVLMALRATGAPR